MGDRANILVKEDDKDPGVYLYTHWCGSELPATLQFALKKNSRWKDTSYLTRIIFCTMVEDATEEDTGFGISTTPPDGQSRILIVDVTCQNIHRAYNVYPTGSMEIKQSWTFQKFCDLDENAIKKVWDDDGD